VGFKTLLVLKDNEETVWSLQYRELYRSKQIWVELPFKQCILKSVYSTPGAVAQNHTKLRKARVRNFLTPIRKKSRNVNIKRFGHVRSWKVPPYNMFYCLRSEVI
jgi:hypothetical protein